MNIARIVDALVAKSVIGPGQTLPQNDLQWQTRPASTASYGVSNPTTALK